MFCSPESWNSCAEGDDDNLVEIAREFFSLIECPCAPGSSGSSDERWDEVREFPAEPWKAGEVTDGIKTVLFLPRTGSYVHQERTKGRS